MEVAELDRILDSAPTSDARLAWFGALLGKECGAVVEIVGGSAIQLYLGSATYTSQDIDLVGHGRQIDGVLARWGFTRIEGRSGRVYWMKKSVGLIDVVGPGDNSGLRPSRIETPYGRVAVSAREPLIVRRLIRSRREQSGALFRQAVELAKPADLDWDYIEAMGRLEGVSSDVARLRAASHDEARRDSRVRE